MRRNRRERRKSSRQVRRDTLLMSLDINLGDASRNMPAEDPDPGWTGRGLFDDSWVEGRK